MQNHYSLIYREEEREMFPTLKVGLLREVAARCTHRERSTSASGLSPGRPSAAACSRIHSTRRPCAPRPTRTFYVLSFSSISCSPRISRFLKAFDIPSIPAIVGRYVLPRSAVTRYLQDSEVVCIIASRSSRRRRARAWRRSRLRGSWPSQASPRPSSARPASRTWRTSSVSRVFALHRCRARADS